MSEAKNLYRNLTIFVEISGENIKIYIVKNSQYILLYQFQVCWLTSQIIAEYIFKKIRTIKGKLESKYPTAFEQINKQIPVQIEEDHEDVDEAAGIDYEQLESTKQVDPAMEARDSSDSTS